MLTGLFIFCSADNTSDGSAKIQTWNLSGQALWNVYHLCWPSRTLQPRKLTGTSRWPACSVPSPCFRREILSFPESWNNLKQRWNQPGHKLHIYEPSLAFRRYTVSFSMIESVAWCSEVLPPHTNAHECTYRVLRCGLVFLASPEVLQKQRQI